MVVQRAAPELMFTVDVGVSDAVQTQDKNRDYKIDVDEPAAQSWQETWALLPNCMRQRFMDWLLSDKEHQVALERAEG